MRIDVRSDSEVLPGEIISEIEKRCRLSLARIDAHLKEVHVVVGPDERALIAVRIANGPEIRVDATEPEMLMAVDHALDRVSRAAHRWIELRKGAERTMAPV